MDMVMLYPPDERINVLAPIVRGRKGEFKKELAALRARGLHAGAHRRRSSSRSTTRHRPRAPARITRSTSLVDRLIVKAGIERRAGRRRSSWRSKLADDIVVINTLDGGDRLFSRRLACPHVRFQRAGDVAAGLLVQLAARRLSRRARGWARSTTSIRRASCPTSRGRSPRARCALGAGRRDARDRDARGPDSARSASIRDVPFAQAAEEAARHRAATARPGDAAGRPASRQAAEPAPDPFGADFEGVIPNLRRRFDDGAWTDQEALERYRALQPCPACEGERLSRRAAPCASRAAGSPTT